MSKGTKKVGIAGKYGPRYGVKARRLIRDIEEKMGDSTVCPNCSYDAVARRDTGIWACRHCGYTFAGGAYIPKTERRSPLLQATEDTEKYDEEARPDV